MGEIYFNQKFLIADNARQISRAHSKIFQQIRKESSEKNRNRTNIHIHQSFVMTDDAKKGIQLWPI